MRAARTPAGIATAATAISAPTEAAPTTHGIAPAMPRAHASAATGLARDAVDILFYASGASAIQSHIPIQRAQRDIQALANHAIMHPQTTIELYGRVLCGLPPNTPLY